MAPICLYACLTTSGHAPNETTADVLGYFLPDLDQGITELLQSEGQPGGVGWTET